MKTLNAEDIVWKSAHYATESVYNAD